MLEKDKKIICQSGKYYGRRSLERRKKNVDSKR